MRLLLKHCHLVIDDYKEYVDGSILINDEYIEDVFPNANKVNINDAKIIDLKGMIVMPAFFENKTDKKIIFDPLMDDASALSIKFHDDNKIVMLGSTNALAKDVNGIYYDGIYNLYNNMTPFHHQEEGLVNLAFTSDKYVEVDLENLSDDVIKFTLNNIKKNKLILINNIENNIKLMRKVNANLTDILSASSLNAYKLYGDTKLDGSLIKGKHSDIVVLDYDLNVLFKVLRGKLCINGGLK